MIVDKNSAIKGFSLFLMTIIAIILLVVCVTTADAFAICIAVINIFIQGVIVYKLYKKWESQ